MREAMKKQPIEVVTEREALLVKAAYMFGLTCAFKYGLPLFDIYMEEESIPLAGNAVMIETWDDPGFQKALWGMIADVIVHPESIDPK